MNLSDVGIMDTKTAGLYFWLFYDDLYRTTTQCIKFLWYVNGRKIEVDVDIRNDYGVVVAPPSRF